MKLLIVDASGHFHRCFHAYPIDPAAQLRYTLQVAIDAYKPDRVISALDAGRETFRQRIYPGYKANRPPTPAGYSDAVPAMLQVLNEFGEKIAVKDYEADDIIGALCSGMYEIESITVHKDSYKINPYRIRILSRDKDLNQLVCENVEQHDDVTGVTYDERAVVERWGVRPERIPDVIGIWGDQADSIPGVVGCGEKIAKELIGYCETLENLYEDLTQVDYLYKNPEKLIKKLEAGRELAFMSKDLATIRRDILLS